MRQRHLRLVLASRQERRSRNGPAGISSFPELPGCRCFASALLVGWSTHSFAAVRPARTCPPISSAQPQEASSKHMTRRVRNAARWLLLGITLCLMTSTFAQQRAERPAGPQEAPSAKTGLPDYEISPEDVLGISVWKEDGLTKEVLVRPD